jgi:hypothetical protein
VLLVDDVDLSCRGGTVVPLGGVGVDWGELLAAAGLTMGRRVTTRHDVFDELRATGAQVVDGARVVDDGDLLTAAG